MKMFIALVVLALASMISAQNATGAISIVYGTVNDPTITGYILFTPGGGNNVTMTVNVTGITKNLDAQHGIHLHQFGDLTTNDGNSVGAHWNSNNQPHGCPENNGTQRHIGDTGNWYVDTTGSIVGVKVLDIITLTGGNSILGFATIVHNATDNCATVASSGVRLAQGVIGVANPTLHGLGGTQNLVSAAPTYSAVNGTTQAVCVLRAASSQGAGSNDIAGIIYFSTTPNGIAVSAVINGLFQDNKPRGIHIHQWGDISAADATAAGPHFTGPYLDNSTHGIPLFGQVRPHHVGDMGNLFVYGTNGTAYYYNLLTSFGLYGDMNSIIGRAVVLHNNTDDCTGTNGNSGARIAQCVIGGANPAFGGAFVPLTEINSTQSIANCPVVGATSGVTASTADMSTTSGVAAIAACAMLVIAAMFA